MSSTPELSREQLASLIPICPLLMDWLRNSTTETADLLMQSLAEDYSSVALGLDTLIKVLHDLPSPDVPFTTFTPILSAHSPTVWSNALRLILTQSSPRIISAEIGSDIVGTIPRLNGASTVTEICHILGPLLDKMPRQHFETLGEFCAMIRDTATNITLIACLVGPQILMPNLALNAEINQGPGALAASAVMELLIIESESLFGRSASVRVYYPFGAYNQVSDSQIISAQVDFISAVNDPDNTVLKRSLRAFYDWRDPIRAYHVDALFKVYPVHQIAGALQQRYGVLPPGWGYILQALVNKEATQKHINQLNDQNISTKLVHNQAATMRRTQLPKNSAQANYKKPLPPPMDNGQVKKMTQEEEAQNRMFATTLAAEVMQKLNDKDVARQKETAALKENDNLVNEICTHEQNYFDVINTFVEAYVSQLNQIAAGNKGDEALTALGLDTNDINALFGEKLTRVRDVSNSLLAKLDVITMFKDASAPVGNRGRIGLLVDAFSEVMFDMDVLSPYIIGYEANIKLLTEKTNKLDTGKGGKKRKKKKQNGTDGQNFLELWELERVKHEALKLSRLDNVLIKPVQRLPMYKIQFGKLVQTTDKTHPAYEDLLRVQDGIEDLAKRIDGAMKSKRKAEKLMGEALPGNQI